MMDLPSTRRPRLIPFLIGLVVVIGLLEGGARATEAAGSPALRWYDASTQLRVDAIRGHEDIDVVFAGTSMAWQGLVPAVWTANDAEGRKAFNVGIAGGVPQVMEPWLLEVVQPRLDPELVVWGLSSLDLSASYGADNAERYYDALDARAGVLAHLEQTAARYSALVRYRNVLRDPSEWSNDRGFGEATAILGPDGERRDFVVDTSEQRRRQVEARLSDYTIDPADIEAIHRTVDELRQRGTDVVFVQMPVPERFIELHPGGLDDVELTRQAITRLGEILDVEVIDAAGGFTDQDFVDFTHLNESAAALLSADVAREVSGVEAEPVEPIITDAELLVIANDLVAVNGQLYSALTQTGSLPASSELWNSSIEYGHTRDLWAYHDAGTDFHTIFAGSSMVYAGLDPEVFAVESGTNAYNTGLPGVGPEEVAAYLNDIVVDATNPQRVIIGIAPRDFAALRPGAACSDLLVNYTTAQERRDSAFARVDWFAATPRRNLLFGDPVEHDSARLIPMHERYREAFTLLGDRRFYPTKSKRFLKKEAARLSELISQYVFCQERLDALSALVSGLDAQGIEVVVVAMPVSSFRVDPLPRGRAQFEQIIADVQEATLSAGASQFLDFTQLLDDDQFYDHTHTDKAASRRLTRAIAAALADG